MFYNKGEPKIEILIRKCHVDNAAAQSRDCKEIPARVIGHLIMFKSYEEPGHVLQHILGGIQTVQFKSDGGSDLGFNIQHDSTLVICCRGAYVHFPKFGLLIKLGFCFFVQSQGEEAV